ncbi:MAG: hypothetical protein ACRDTC_24015 [Pseudonocardiaceae bacterium]
MRADRDRLTDVLEAIERIQHQQNPGREVFDTDELDKLKATITSALSV